MRCRPENQGAFEALMEKQLDQGSRGCVHTIFLMFKGCTFFYGFSLYIVSIWPHHAASHLLV
jgi:hypothetical protein